jgi:hypothetical protein
MRKYISSEVSDFGVFRAFNYMKLCSTQTWYKIRNVSLEQCPVPLYPNERPSNPPKTALRGGNKADTMQMLRYMMIDDLRVYRDSISNDLASTSSHDYIIIDFKVCGVSQFTPTGASVLIDSEGGKAKTYMSQMLTLCSLSSLTM